MPEELEIVISAKNGRQQLAATSSRLLALMPEDFPEERLSRLRLGLQEILQNAYEHGTLGISGSEKREACESEFFEELCRRRETERPYSERLIQVHAKVAKGLFSCCVTDEGEGFDWKSVKNNAPDGADLESLHGRGVLISLKVFDDVVYNAKGNSVTVFLTV